MQQTTIIFQLQFANLVKVDETGELLAAKSIGEQPAGNHSVKISATNGFATVSSQLANVVVKVYPVPCFP